jgi:WD40 repeat protein
LIRLLSGFGLLAATLLFVGSGRAQVSQAASTEPILGIEAGQHGAGIRRIDTDAENRFAVTASEDKTARVWSLPDGKLQRTLHLPIDLNNAGVGKAYAVAIWPDGDTVAVGGWTTTQGSHDIFLFDRASGELKQRLANVPSVTNHLAYSSDGRHLAVSLGEKNGIRVFDAANSFRLLPSDTHYGGSSIWAMFDRAGRLVTTSFDGFVRLYAADSYSAPIAWYDSKGREPYAAAFSPDGTSVAVGYADASDVTILSGSNLTLLSNTDTTGVINGNMAVVGWSQDGRFLFAGGTYSNGDRTAARRWSNAGRGAFVDIPAGSDSIIDIRALKSGAMLFAHIKGFGLIRQDARANALQSLGSLALNSGRGPLRVSADGGAVQVDSRQPKHTYRFTLARRVVDIDPPPDDRLIAPITKASGLAVTGWEHSAAPAVNGVPIKLELYDLARSIAIVRGTQRFVLGTNFSLRLVDQKAQDVWPNALSIPAVAWHVNVTADGRLVVAAYDDGTIR